MVSNVTWARYEKGNFMRPDSSHKTSILTVLYWPETGHTSYFTGGDGNPLVEQSLVAPLLTRAKVLNERNPKGETSMVIQVRLHHPTGIRKEI